MDQTSSDKTVFDPDNLQYDLHADHMVCCFNAAGVSAVPFTLTVGKGAPLSFYGSDPHPLRIGGRLCVNTGTLDLPVRGDLVWETRVAREPFVAEQGQRYRFALPVEVPAEAPPELMLEIDLVQEHRCWGSELGHRPLTLLLTNRRIAIKPAYSDPTDMSEALMQLHDARAREQRYEAMIFALLNKLPGRDEQAV